MRKPDVPGFFSWFGYSLPIEDRLRLISEAGFDRVSIWLGDEEACVSEHRPADLCAAAAWNGLCVECAHAPYDDCNLLWSDEDSAANPLIGRMVSWIRFCGTQGIPVMVMHLTRGDDPLRSTSPFQRSTLPTWDSATTLPMTSCTLRTRRTSCIAGEKDSPPRTFRTTTVPGTVTGSPGEARSTGPGSGRPFRSSAPCRCRSRLSRSTPAVRAAKVFCVSRWRGEWPSCGC